jgi:hypothetical protein
MYIYNLHVKLYMYICVLQNMNMLKAHYAPEMLLFLFLKSFFIFGRYFYCFQSYSLANYLKDLSFGCFLAMSTVICDLVFSMKSKYFSDYIMLLFKASIG